MRDIEITETTEFKRAMNGVNFINPDEHAVTIPAGYVLRYPTVDGVVITELPPWFTCDSPVHFGAQPLPPKLVNVSFGDIDDNGGSDISKVWEFSVQWAVDNPTGTGPQYKASFQNDAEMQTTIYYSGVILQRVLAKAVEAIPEVTTYAELFQWMRDNADAEDILRVL